MTDETNNPQPEQPQGEFVEVPQGGDTPEPTIEERFAALQKKADEIGCALRISLVVGGVKRDEVYHIWEATSDDATLSEDLAMVETQLADPRLLASVEATNRMVDAERLLTDTNKLVLNRQEEHRIAIKALRQTYEHGNKPEDGDNIQERIGMIAAYERDRKPSEILAEILKKAYEANAPEPEAPPTQS